MNREVKAVKHLYRRKCGLYVLEFLAAGTGQNFTVSKARFLDYLCRACTTP
jgi:hypothetical protein